MLEPPPLALPTARERSARRTRASNLADASFQTGLIGAASGVALGPTIEVGGLAGARRIEIAQRRHMPFTTFRFRAGFKAFAE